jgi:hypothetical protein
MLWTIVFVLLVLWLLGFALDIGGNLIHLILFAAVALVFGAAVAGRGKARTGPPFG